MSESTEQFNPAQEERLTNPPHERAVEKREADRILRDALASINKHLEKIDIELGTWANFMAQYALAQVRLHRQLDTIEFALTRLREEQRNSQEAKAKK